MNSQIQEIYHGYIGRQSNGYLPPTIKSEVNLAKLYEGQLAGNHVDIYSSFSDYSDQLFWASVGEYKMVSVAVASSRFMAKLSMESDFRQRMQNPINELPCVMTAKAYEKDLYILTEGAGNELYPFSPTLKDLGHIIAQEVDPNSIDIRIASPKFIQSMYQLLRFRDTSINRHIVENMIISSGYNRMSELDEVIQKVTFNELGRPRTLFGAIHHGYVSALERGAAQKLIRPEQYIDMVARGIYSNLYPVLAEHVKKDELFIGLEEKNEQHYDIFRPDETIHLEPLENVLQKYHDGPRNESSPHPQELK